VDVINQDLQFMEIEADVEKWKEKNMEKPK
jgi:hypothetical protein